VHIDGVPTSGIRGLAYTMGLPSHERKLCLLSELLRPNASKEELLRLHKASIIVHDRYEGYIVQLEKPNDEAPFSASVMVRGFFHFEDGWEFRQWKSATLETVAAPEHVQVIFEAPNKPEKFLGCWKPMLPDLKKPWRIIW